MDLSVVIVNWNSAEYLDRCLDSLLRHLAPGRSEVLVVDNASSDGSAGLVRERYAPRGVRLIENTENRGFAAANNQGAALSRGRYLLFLNPDTELTGTLDLWLQFMDENPGVSVSGCRLLNTDGSHQPSVRRLPGLWLAFDRYTPLRPLLRSFRRGYKPDFSAVREPREAEQVSGAALLVRAGLFGAQPVFDERFFIFYEEVDLCLRARQGGGRVVYFPQTSIVHHGGKSRARARADINAVSLRSMLQYFRKHRNPALYLAFAAAFKPLFLLQLFLDLLTLWPASLRRRLGGRGPEVGNFEKRVSFVRKHLLDFLFRY